MSGAGESFLSSHGRLDVLVNNAGGMATPELRTAQGFEMHFGVNHQDTSRWRGSPCLFCSNPLSVSCV